MSRIRKQVSSLPLAFLLVGLLGAVPFVAACGGDEDSDVEVLSTANADPDPDPEAGVPTENPGPYATSINVKLSEWSVMPEKTTASAGIIRFVADNEGERTHELVLYQDGKELGEVEGLGAGKVESMTLKVAPGKYELACLIVEATGDKADHYQKGMKVAFEVK